MILFFEKLKLKCTPKEIIISAFIYLFISDWSCDRPQDAQSSRNNRIFVKNSVKFKSVRFTNDCVVTQHTPKCVENCSDDQLSSIYSSNYYQFFCNLDYNSENSVFFFGQLQDSLQEVHSRQTSSCF